MHASRPTLCPLVTGTELFEIAAVCNAVCMLQAQRSNVARQILSLLPPAVLRCHRGRPIKTRQSKSWQAVWINPEDIIGAAAQGQSVRTCDGSYMQWCFAKGSWPSAPCPPCSPHPAAEGLLISPHMYRDHLCSTAYEALTNAADAAGQLEASIGAADGRVPTPGSPRSRGREAERRRQRAARHRWQQRLAAQRSSSLQEVLVEAV